MGCSGARHCQPAVDSSGAAGRWFPSRTDSAAAGGRQDECAGPLVARGIWQAMSGFSAQWLALREPLDAESRDSGLVAALIDSLATQSLRKAPLEVVDLGAGTGANLRYAAPRLGGVQNWLLVERDPLLFAAVEECMSSWADESDALISGSGASLALRDERFDCRIQCVAMDLATQLDQLPLPAAGLLTACALLDLVSEEWLRALIRNAADAQLAVWFALS